MPLRGINVIEFGGLAPAPFCGMILKEFGASVTRIDKIGQSQNLDVLGNGKKSIALDLKSPRARDIIKKLCRKNDVLIEPFRPGVMEKLGLGPNILLSENPRLIYARLTGFGQTGFYSPRAGHDINYIAISGILSMLGRKNQKPEFPINLLADFAGGGLLCALGISLALLERIKSNKGQIIDASMSEGAAYIASWLVRSQSLPIWGKNKGENILDGGVHFYDTYETKDGKYMAVGALEPQFYDNFIQGLGLRDVPQYTDFDKGKDVISKKFLEKTQEEWCQIFDNVDACVSPVLTVDEVSKHRHNIDRGSFVKGPDYDLEVARPAPVLSRTPGVSRACLKNTVIGQDSVDVLYELGFDKDEIEVLLSDGVVEQFSKSRL